MPTVLNEALSVLMLCAPSNRRRPFSCHTKMADFEYFRVLAIFLWEKKKTKIQKNVLNMASSDSLIDKPQRWCPQRAELPDVNNNTDMQSNINTERASLNHLYISFKQWWLKFWLLKTSQTSTGSICKGKKLLDHSQNDFHSENCLSFQDAMEYSLHEADLLFRVHHLILVVIHSRN